MINILKDWSVSIILILLIIGIGVVLVLSSNGVIGFGTGSKSSNSNMRQLNINPTNNSNSPMKPNSNNNSMIMPQMNSGSQEEDFKTLIDDVKKLLSNQNVMKKDIKDLSNNQKDIASLLSNTASILNDLSDNQVKSDSDIASLKQAIEDLTQFIDDLSSLLTQGATSEDATESKYDEIITLLQNLQGITSSVDDEINQLSDQIVITEAVIAIDKNKINDRNASFIPISYDNALQGDKILLTSNDITLSLAKVVVGTDESRIYLMDIDGSNKINISWNEDNKDSELGLSNSSMWKAFGASWSPNGKEISYTLSKIDDGFQWFSIVVMNLENEKHSFFRENYAYLQTNNNKFVGGGIFSGKTAWSPDYTSIAYEDLDIGSTIGITVQTGPESLYSPYSITKLTSKAPPEYMEGYSGTGKELHPSWSPDGSKISFSSNFRYDLGDGVAYKIENFEIYTIDKEHLTNKDGSNITRLTNTTKDVSNTEPSWSPDGTKIAFVSNRDGNKEIYVMNADGTNQTRITNNIMLDFNPSWSADGSKIIFTSTRDGYMNLYTIGVEY